MMQGTQLNSGSGRSKNGHLLTEKGCSCEPAVYEYKFEKLMRGGNQGAKVQGTEGEIVRNVGCLERGKRPHLLRGW